MERLIVDNFLNLKHIELDLNKFNIIIGPQAQGKSILAKLVYFFEDFFKEYKQSIINIKSNIEFNELLQEKFKRIFPKYSWELKKFKIIYYFDEYEIAVSNNIEELASNLSKFNIKYSENLSEKRVKIIKDINKKTTRNLENMNDIDKVIEKVYFIQEKKYVEKLVNETLFSSKTNIPKEVIFIPAGRSFFTNIQNNIFSLMSENISIDYFLIEFGSIYETMKVIYELDQAFNQHYHSINTAFENLINGSYLYENKEDYIIDKYNNKIKLINASSGQQEIVPIMVILANYPFSSSNRFFFIEEPEAHLFPTSQKDIIELIALIFNFTDRRHNFFITTHSPYILTAFNNLIQAGNVKRKSEQTEESKTKLKKLFKIIPEEQILDINDFGVYTLENGELTNIINEENQLIDTNVIDEVSNDFSDTFEQLLDLEFEE